MKSRVSWVGIVLAAMLATASVSLAEDAGYRAHKGGIGGQLGISRTIGEEDYSEDAILRPSMAVHWRYAFSSWLRWQFSPGFTWAGYDDQSTAPFRDPNFPEDSTKAEYLAELLPFSAQLQVTTGHGPWLFYGGLGPGAYRVWVTNRHKVLEDPVSRKLHNGIYPGVTAQIGAERFFKSLPSTSIEFTLDGHYVFAQRDDQFPSGFNSTMQNIGLRIGGNYYFVTNAPKKKDAGAPGVAPKP